MFASALSILAACALLARADTLPTSPAPGDVFNTGKDCTLAWDADPAALAAWKTTSIELMTGDNLNMVHITTLTVVDGTVAGTYKYTCPAVTVNSAIYFYQFSGPGTPKQWTGRFAIAAADGTTTPPANALQPDGSAKPWGVGALVDSSTAVAAPGATGGTAGAPNGTATATATAGNSTTTPVVPNTSSPISTTSKPNAAAVNTPTTTSSATKSATSASNTNAALVLDAHIWKSGVALGASALTFALLL